MDKNKQELIKLIKDNPDLEIKPFVSYEVVGDDYGYWVSEIQRIVKSEYWILNERVYLEDEYDTFLDEIDDLLCGDFPIKNESYLIARDLLIYNASKGKAIFIYIGI